MRRQVTFRATAAGEKSQILVGAIPDSDRRYTYTTTTTPTRQRAINSPHHHRHVDAGHRQDQLEDSQEEPCNNTTTLP